MTSYSNKQRTLEKLKAALDEVEKKTATRLQDTDNSNIKISVRPLHSWLHKFYWTRKSPLGLLPILSAGTTKIEWIRIRVGVILGIGISSG